MSHHIVAAENLCYSYPDGTQALQGVSFHISHGESVALIGANGAGKSTLLLHLNGYLTPREGRVRIGDFPLTRSTRDAVRRSVGMVFQNPDDQLFMPTVREDVAFGPLNLGLPSAEVEERVCEALRKVDARHLIDRPPYRLSTGEKRRVSIAAVLAMSPDILVLDEPTTGLDPRSRRQLIELLLSFTHTKIVATHDLDLVMDVCERSLVIHEGRILADGKTEEIFSDEALLARSHLEKPLKLQGCPVCGGTSSGKQKIG